jgi:plasmid stability protein
MSVALQIRGVPEDVRDALAHQAAKRGQSMQAYLLDMVEREARMVRQSQAFEHTAGQRFSIPESLSPEQLVREGRDAGYEVDRA